MPKPQASIPLDYQTGTVVIPAGSIKASHVDSNISLFYMPVCILGTSKLGQCILGTQPMVLGYARLGEGVLMTNPRDR